MTCPCRATEYALLENAKRGRRIAELEECLLTAEERLAQVTRERDAERRTFANAAAEMGCEPEDGDDLVEAVKELTRERDEARAETARLRRLLNMAEDELVAADDHGRREAKRADNVEAEVEALKAERDEARAEVEKLSESAKAAWEAECVMRDQRDRYHAELKQERQEVERLRKALEASESKWAEP